jgi:hypothetical protein
LKHNDDFDSDLTDSSDTENETETETETNHNENVSSLNDKDEWESENSGDEMNLIKNGIKTESEKDTIRSIRVAPLEISLNNQDVQDVLTVTCYLKNTLEQLSQGGGEEEEEKSNNTKYYKNQRKIINPTKLFSAISKK